MPQIPRLLEVTILKYCATDTITEGQMYCTTNTVTGLAKVLHYYCHYFLHYFCDQII